MSEHLGPILATHAPALCTGRLYEPRLLYATLNLPVGGAIQRFDSNVFRNGERYPLHLTHLVWAVRDRDYGASVSTAEEQLQRVQARLTWHDSWYMGFDPMDLPLWQNQQGIAIPEPLASGAVTWRFLRPIELPTRAAFEVSCSLERTQLEADGTIPIAVCFRGRGIKSRQEFMFASRRSLGFGNANGGLDVNLQIVPVADFTNDGVEPIAITDMTISVGPQTLDTSPVGNIRLGRINVTMIQGGTGTPFAQNRGTTSGAADVDCPAVLWGVSAGRAVVHVIPDGGWILEPGRGFDAEMLNLNASGNFNLNVAMGAAGYLVVP